MADETVARGIGRMSGHPRSEQSVSPGDRGSSPLNQRVRRLVQAGAPAWVIGWYLSEAGLREQKRKSAAARLRLLEMWRDER